MEFTALFFDLLLIFLAWAEAVGCNLSYSFCSSLARRSKTLGGSKVWGWSNNNLATSFLR